MAASLIGSSNAPRTYTDYTVMHFPDWRALQAFAMEVKTTNPSREVEEANENFKVYVNR